MFFSVCSTKSNDSVFPVPPNLGTVCLLRFTAQNLITVYSCTPEPRYSVFVKVYSLEMNYRLFSVPQNIGTVSLLRAYNTNTRYSGFVVTQSLRVH